MTITPTILNISQIDSSGLAITITTPVDDIKGFQVEVANSPNNFLPLSTRNKLEIGFDYLLFVGEKESEELAGERNTSQIILNGYVVNDLVQIRVRNVDINDVVSDWLTSDVISIVEQTLSSVPNGSTPLNFNFFENDFNLCNSLQNEVVKSRGIDVIFLPRQFQKVDLILGEDVLSHFDQSFSMKMYLASFSEFGGDGSVFGQFGLSVSDQATFEVNIDEFNRVTNNYQPVEGDIIYVTLGKWIMEMFHFKKHDPFFHLGKVSKYTFEVRKYEYTNEEMDTGIEELDMLDNLQSTDVENDSDAIIDEIDDILNSTETNIFGDK